MWTTRTTRGPAGRRAGALLLAGLLSTATLAACGGDSEPDRPSAVSARAISEGLATTLRSRAAAVRDHDDAAFLRQVGGGRAFRSSQETWFGNLSQLPLQRLGYRVRPATLVRDGDEYQITVEQSLQLAGYDATPVVTQGRYRFRAAPHDPRRFRLVSVSDAEWDATHDVPRQPWDLGPIEVREAPGVLGIFDADSVADAPALLSSVQGGIAAVADRVPYSWSRTVVVYALSDPAFMESLEDLPDDPGDLDAVAFRVGSGTRFVLDPSMLDRPGPERDRLIRHELTHVAVGTHDDGAPVWLSEGLAEWVSVAPLATQDRRIPDSAIRAAEAGLSDLPDDATFNDADSAAHYGVAWWAVEYLADTYGQEEPWRLLDAMTVPGADPDTVLADQLGINSQQLAGRAGRLIVSVYDPTGS